MIRDRLKNAARSLGKRLFLPEERASVRARAPLERSDGAGVADDVLPPIQDGDGDTPGPNHKTDIGRTYAAAQLLGGAGIVALDVRSPSEWAVGHLPHAVLAPRELWTSARPPVDVLPPPDGETWIAVYDATGDQGAGDVAELLRQKGWARARKLVRGYAEWVEEGEEVVVPEPAAGGPQIGDTVRLNDGRSGIVWRRGNKEPRWAVMVGHGAGATSVDVTEKELAR